MKAKISRGDGFRGALNYIHAKGDAEKVGGNMSGRTVLELTKEFGITKKLRPDCKNPVWHCSLALPEGDRLGAERWDEISTDFMIEMGMDPSNFLYDVQRHSDTDHDHIHIVASRIGLDGSLWHGQNDVFKAIEATQRLEKKYGLTLTPGLDPEHKKERKSLTSKEINMGVRTETKPPRLVAQEAIDEVLQSKGVISAPEFISRLEAFGVRAVPAVASTGTMNGFSFECEGVSFTGSKLGESFKWKQLQTRGVEYEQARDFAALADARRRASERSAVGPDAGRDLGAAGPDRTPGAELGAVAELGSGPGDRGAIEPRSIDQATGPSANSVGGIRSDRPGPEANTRGTGAGNQQTSRVELGTKSGDAGRVHQFIDRGNGEHVQGGQDFNGSTYPRDSQDFSIAGQGDAGSNDGSDIHAGRGAGADQSSAERETEPLVSVVPNAGRGAFGGGWASRFKQASATKRVAAERVLGSVIVGKGDGARAKVNERNIVTAREIDPTAYLESQGFTVKKSGTHNLVVMQGSDEVYRCTLKDHWITCDKYRNGIGDNIALVAELEPGTPFAEAVYRLAGAPSVARALRPAAQAPVRKPPSMPAQTDFDIKAGRDYLINRGISIGVIQDAEAAGMLRYSAGGVLFVGRDDQGTAWNITRRAVDASEATQKRDIAGTDKGHPQILIGASETVLIVEGGADALAAVDIARRENRPAPTILVTGGAGNRSWMQTPWVQKILSVAKKIMVCFDREDSPEIQIRTDSEHELQMQKLREVCTAQVTGWKPPEGCKDMAALNLVQVQEIRAAAEAQMVARPAITYPSRYSTSTATAYPVPRG